MQERRNYKQTLAALLRWRPLRWLLRAAVRLFAPTHRVGVTVIVLDAHQRILLLNHVFHPTLPWGAPGGWLNRGEDPRAGAARELWEETGITAELGPLLYLRREKFPDHIGMAFLACLTEAPTADQLQLSREIISAHWFTADTLPRLSSFTHTSITAALAHKNA